MSTRNCCFLFIILVLGVIIYFFSLVYYMDGWIDKVESELTGTGYNKIHPCWQVLTDHINQRVLVLSLVVQI